MSKKLHLHLDADTSSKALYNALCERGHHVTRTLTKWMPFDASDEGQLKMARPLKVAPFLID